MKAILRSKKGEEESRLNNALLSGMMNHFEYNAKIKELNKKYGTN